MNAVTKALENLQEQLCSRGLRLMENKGRYQLTTAPELSEAVESFLHLEATSRLSPAALEALAIVAYQQPATRPFIDSIRGVNSDSVIRTLLERNLIEVLGRKQAPGKPMIYGTTSEFLMHFGLKDLSELPSIEEIERMLGTPEEEMRPEIREVLS